MKRLTRKEIQEGLKAVPIEQILMGRVESPETRLTPKQIRFAEQIARGESKASAYRKSRETKAKPASASRQGQELMKNPAIVSQVEAFKVAIEAERLRTPAQLRAFIIHELTKGALNTEMPPAQKVKCLELLGKITEVALFTDRREVVQINRSEDIKSRLVAILSKAVKANAEDAQVAGESLLKELAGPVSEENPRGEGHHPGTPQNSFDDSVTVKHTNPHIGSGPEAHLPDVIDMDQPENSDASNTLVSGDTSVKSL